jgi:hypothetical protein
MTAGQLLMKKQIPLLVNKKNCKVLPQCSFKDFNYVYLFVCQLGLISKNEFVVEGIE